MSETKYNPDMSDEEFQAFCEMPENLKRIVAGRFEDVTGKVTYADGAGTHFSPEDFEVVYGYNPEDAWQRIQKWRTARKEGCSKCIKKLGKY